MSWTRSTMLVFLAVFAAALCLPKAGYALPAPCTAETVEQVIPPDVVGPPAPATSGNGGLGLDAITPGEFLPTLNEEGLTERPLDLLIFDNGTGTCFPAGEQIVITYNAALTTPNPVAVSGTDLDVMDSAGASGLVVTASTAVGLSTFDTPQTVITITVQQAGTAGNLTAGFTGSAIRLKNLRFDVTSLVGPTTVDSTISTSNPVTSVSSANTQVNGSAVLAVGFIFPTISFAENFEGFGFQSTPTGLCVGSEIDFGEAFGNAFRTAITSQAVYKDIPTGATSLIFDVTGIPSGVTVTFPSIVANSSGVAGHGLVFNARSATLSATGGSLAVIYDTQFNGPGNDNIDIDTADSAANVGNSVDKDDSLVGVAVGSNTGFGEASIQIAFGPTPTAAFTGDDANASAIPRYISSIGVPEPTRNILLAGFFNIKPVETVLLYPYVTDMNGFVTGLEIANTGNSNNIFVQETCDGGEPFPPVTVGSITFWFFPNGAAPFSYTAKAADGRGLDANGNLDPGNIFAVSLDALLSASGNSAMVGKFDGYVMAVNQFNFGHGFSIIFDSSGHGVGSTNALVVGPFTGQKRSGQVKLPEALGSVAKRKH